MPWLLYSDHFLFGYCHTPIFSSPKNRKIENYHWIMRISVSAGTKFQNEMTILIFWTKVTQKGYSPSKTEKVKITTEFCIFELVQLPNFSLTLQCWFFGPNLPKKSWNYELAFPYDILLWFPTILNFFFSLNKSLISSPSFLFHLLDTQSLFEQLSP